MLVFEIFVIYENGKSEVNKQIKIIFALDPGDLIKLFLALFM